MDAGYTVRYVHCCRYTRPITYLIVNTFRGTVRSASKGDYLVNLFKSYKGKFHYAIVEDIAKVGLLFAWLTRVHVDENGLYRKARSTRL